MPHQACGARDCGRWGRMGPGHACIEKMSERHDQVDFRDSHLQERFVLVQFPGTHYRNSVSAAKNSLEHSAHAVRIYGGMEKDRVESQMFTGPDSNKLTIGSVLRLMKERPRRPRTGKELRTESISAASMA
jgi:hypothetical protein